MRLRRSSAVGNVRCANIRTVTDPFARAFTSAFPAPGVQRQMDLMNSAAQGFLLNIDQDVANNVKQFLQAIIILINVPAHMHATMESVGTW